MPARRARFFFVLTRTALLAVSAPLLAAGHWEPGVHYEVLPAGKADGRRNGRIRILEFFSYPCGSCYALEPHVAIWRLSRPGFAELVQVPVVYLPEARAYARLHYTLQALGRSDLFHEIFDSIYRAGKPLYAADERRALALQLEFATSHAVDAREFMRVYESPAVKSALRNAEILTRFYLVDGTPTMVIAGRYKAMVGQAGGYDMLMALVTDLAREEHRRCCASERKLK